MEMGTDWMRVTREERLSDLSLPLQIAPENPSVVLGGLGKTGTTSLNEALRILGFNSVHCPQTPVAGADSYTDSPVFLPGFFGFSEKFIFLTRYKEEWLRSCERHFSKPPANEFFRQLRLYVFGDVYFDRMKWSHSYITWEVQSQNLYGDRLLKMDIREGWKPLCEFLNKPIPSVPFPHLNHDIQSLFSLADSDS